MNQEPRANTSRPGEPISESAVRDALGPQARTTEATRAEDHRLSEPGAEAVAAHASPPRSRVTALRRWSVAELLAEAVSRPPTAAVAR